MADQSTAQELFYLVRLHGIEQDVIAIGGGRISGRWDLQVGAFVSETQTTWSASSLHLWIVRGSRPCHANRVRFGSSGKLEKVAGQRDVCHAAHSRKVVNRNGKREKLHKREIPADTVPLYDGGNDDGEFRNCARVSGTTSPVV